jgi:glutamyl-Q tRNA(Asp) synthetase
VLTRFAPSPTGYLHLGHVVNAIYVWGIAQARGGRVRLRIEDHDRLRCRPEFDRALLEDLDWLRFEADEGRHPPDRQSEHPEIYEAALRQLASRYHVYGCTCSRKDIGAERYDGRCRDRGLALGPGVGIRIALDAPDESGDLLLKDRDGHWTYQFSVTVDDVRQGITTVIRGEDLASSTARQIRLAEMLGRPSPAEYVHHPLIVGAGGAKLSKAARDTGIRELRAQGLTPEIVIGQAAAAVGLVAPGTALPAADVASLF